MIAFTILLMSESYEVLVGCMFAIGAMSTIRVQVASAYFFEFFPRSQFKCVFTILGTISSLAGVVVALYFSYVSKNAI